MPRPKIALFHQQTAKGCEDPSRAAAVHGHPQPVGGFLLGHRVDPSDTPRMHVRFLIGASARKDRPAEARILRQISARNLAGPQRPDVDARGAICFNTRWSTRARLRPDKPPT